MKAYGRVDVQIHIFLTSALVGGEWSASRPGCSTSGERAPGTLWIGGWVDPRASLDDMKKRKFLTLLGLELRPLGRPASGYTDYAIPAPYQKLYSWELNFDSLVTSQYNYLQSLCIQTENKSV
jgi:hypothetical protein